MQIDLTGRVAIVTGAAHGIGRAICTTLAGAGARIWAVDILDEPLAGTVAAVTEAGGSCGSAVVNLTDSAAVGRFVEQVVAAEGRIDILVNTAGGVVGQVGQPVETITDEAWDAVVRANLNATFYCIRAVAPQMKAGGGGRIVNISSVAGFQPTGSSIAYAVSKAGLSHLTRCLAVALAPDILVNCVAPGLMEGTRMTEALHPDYVERAKSGSALKRAASKDDVAAQVVAFCQTDSVTGQNLVIDAGRFYH